MVPKLTNFAQVKELLNNFVNSAGVTPGQAPHGVFWDTTYADFKQLKIFGKYRVVTPGNVAKSDIIAALNGTLSGIPRMPKPSPPYESATPSQDEVVAALTAWIVAGCPDGTTSGSGGGKTGGTPAKPGATAPKAAKGGGKKPPKA